MKAIFDYKYLIFIFFTGIFIFSCSNKTIIPADISKRLDSYLYSENGYIAAMFSDDHIAEKSTVQPALTQVELDILDVLASKIPQDVRQKFDEKYTAWLNCWAPLDSLPEAGSDVRLSLKCNGKEFHDLIEFCRQQNDDVFLLLYQLAARAQCPYDQLLLYPVYDLAVNFPEFNKYWREVNLSLQHEKPDLRLRTCNESTIWHTRKILETKYGYTPASGLMALFDTRKSLLMTQ